MRGHQPQTQSCSRQGHQRRRWLLPEACRHRHCSPLTAVRNAAAQPHCSRLLQATAGAAVPSRRSPSSTTGVLGPIIRLCFLSKIKPRGFLLQSSANQDQPSHVSGRTNYRRRRQQPSERGTRAINQRPRYFAGIGAASSRNTTLPSNTPAAPF